MCRPVRAAKRVARGGASFVVRRFAALVVFAVVATFSVAARAQLAISDSGTPTFSQAVAVPPGVAGMSPKIGVSYSGGGVNGPLGYGWSLQGISIITRCPGIKAIDGVKTGVTFTASDKLCLDGQRLIQTDASGNVINGSVQSPSATNPFQTNDSLGIASTAAPREFRTEKDSYARIRAYGYADGVNAASGPAYFKVWTKSGQIYEYGAGPSADANSKALIAPYGRAVPVVWAVARISDASGNFMDFKYEQRDQAWGTGGTLAAPTPGHEWNLLEIQYSGNKVIFSYADRPDNTSGAIQDRAEAWRQGSKNVSVRLLQSVTTYINSPNPTVLGAAVGAVPVKTLQLGYGSGAVSGRSRVQSIKECAGNISGTKCLPATNFTYADGGSEAYQAAPLFTASPVAKLQLMGSSNAYSVLTGDFNADGRTDILRVGNTPLDNQLLLSQGDGTFTAVPAGTGSGQFNLTTQRLFSSDGCYNSVVADLNGDGIPDILRTVQTTNSSGGNCPTDTALLFIGNGDGSFKAAQPLTGIDLSTVTEVYTSSTSSCVLGSIPLRDGDLLAMADITVAANSASCANHFKTVGKNFYLLDVNGDGFLDIVTTVNPAYSIYYQTGNSVPTPDQACLSVVCSHVYLGSAAGTFTELTTTNLAHHSVYADPPVARGAVFKANTVDVDGDGLTDLAVFRNGTWRSNGDGNFTLLSSYGAACNTPLDFNGDGTADCLITTSVGASANNLGASSGMASVVVPRFNLTQAGQELTTPSGSPIALESVVVDVNGDGRSDLLRWSDDPTKNVVYLSNGDGSFTPSTTFNLNTAAYQLKKSDGSFDFVIGDFTGRGTSEILRLSASPATTPNQLYSKVDVTPLDQLVSVTSSAGAVTKLYYVPMTNSSPLNSVSGLYGPRYTGDRGTANAAVSPQLDVAFPMYLVATSVSDNGIGGSVATEYSYLGLKADINGRGLLGFREVRRQSPGPDPASSALTTSTQYLQAQPYIGVASRTDTRLGTVNNTSGTLISSTVNAYCDLTASTSAYASALASAQSSQPNVFCPTTAKVQRPYLLLTKDSGTDLDGTAFPVVTTQNTHLASGDPGTIAVTTVGNVAGSAQTFAKTTTNLYFPDNTANDNWVLGRLSSASVQSTVPNVLASLSTSAGTAPNASASAGTGALQAALLTPASYNFGSLAPNTSTTQQFTLANDGAGTLTITVPSAASVAGTDFSFASTTCTSTLAVGASCRIVVNFTPTTVVSRTGTLSVATGATTLTSSLSGTGGGSKATLTSAATLAVPPTWYTAAAQSVSATYRNDGNSAMTLASPTLNAPLSVTSNNCTAVAPNASCSIAISAATNVSGIAQSQSFVPSGATSAPAATTITWTTYTVVPRWGVTSLSFGNVAVGSAAAQNITLYNDGNTGINWATNSGVSNAPAGYSFNTAACSNVAAGGGSCNVVVTLTASSATAYSGSGIAMTSASYASNTLTVNGTGVTPPNISSSPTSISAAAVWPAAATGSISFANSGQTPTTLTLSATGGISVSPATLNCPANGSCGTVTVSSPAVMGSYSGNLSVASSAGGAPGAIGLSLTVNGSVASLTNSTSSLTFPNTTAGAPAPTLFWTFQNTGNANMTLTPSALNSPFVWTNNTCSNIAPLQLCGMYAQMTTATVGNFSQTGISVTGAAQGNRSDLGLSGAVGAGTATVSVSPTSLTFATVPKGSTSAPLTLTFTNTGNVSAGLLGVTFNYTFGTTAMGDFASRGGTCGAALAAGASCTMAIVFEGACTGGTVKATMNLPGLNFTTVPVNLIGANSSAGACR